MIPCSFGIWHSRFYLLEPIVVICSETEYVVRRNASTLYIRWPPDASSINYSHWLSSLSCTCGQNRIYQRCNADKITLAKMQTLPMHILTSEALNACWIVFSFSRPLSRRKFSCSTAPVSSSVHTTQTNSDEKKNPSKSDQAILTNKSVFIDFLHSSQYNIPLFFTVQTCRINYSTIRLWAWDLFFMPIIWQGHGQS